MHSALLHREAEARNRATVLSMNSMVGVRLARDRRPAARPARRPARPTRSPWSPPARSACSARLLLPAGAARRAATRKRRREPGSASRASWAAYAAARSRSILRPRKYAVPHSSAKIGAEHEHHRHHEAQADRGDLHRPAEQRRPTRARSSPASRRQATSRPSPTASAVPSGDVGDRDHHRRRQPDDDRPRASRTAAHMPRRGERLAVVGHPRPSQQASRLADGDHGAGDQHRAGAERVAEGLPRLGEGRGLVDRVGEARHDRDPVLAVDLAAASASCSAGSARSVEFWVQTTWARCGSNAASTPSWSLSAITPITPIERVRTRTSRRARRPRPRAPCGLWAASSTIVGLRRITSSRPGEVDLGEGAAHQLVVERLLADERLDRRQRDGGVLGLVGAVQRQEHLVVPRAQALQGHHLAADRRAPGTRPRTRCPRGPRWHRPRRRCRSSTSADLGRLLGDHRDRAGLDDAGLLDGDLPRACRRGRTRGRRRSAAPRRPRASATLVASQTPPMPTSTTATSTGASANAAYAMPTMVSKNDSGWASVESTRWVYGATSLNARTNASSLSGSPSTQIRSLIRSTWGR